MANCLFLKISRPFSKNHAHYIIYQPCNIEIISIYNTYHDGFRMKLETLINNNYITYIWKVLVTFVKFKWQKNKKISQNLE